VVRRQVKADGSEVTWRQRLRKGRCLQALQRQALASRLHQRGDGEYSMREHHRLAETGYSTKRKTASDRADRQEVGSVFAKVRGSS